MIGLQWNQVDPAQRMAWIHTDQAKARQAIAVPLNDMAMSVLTAESGKHSTRVFTYKGNPIKQVNTKAWRQAVKDVGLKDFRWHDLRHTQASWLAMKGATLAELRI